MSAPEPSDGNADNEAHEERPRGIFDGFEAYRTPSDDDYRHVLTAGMLVPDANVLLNLYRFTAETQADLLSALGTAQERIWVPHQVMIEFWRNRESKLTEAKKQTDESLQKLEELKAQAVAALRTWENAVALDSLRRKNLEASLSTGFDEVTDEISKIIAADKDRQHRNTNDDPVVRQLESVLQGRVGAPMPPSVMEAAAKEGLRRVAEQIPPGYKDKRKGDDAAGDYLVWKQVIDEAKLRKVDVLFITGDIKEDWWRRVDGQTIGPRPELVEEIKTEAGVRLFLLRPESFLIQARAGLRVNIRDESVQEVERLSTSSKDCGWTSDSLEQLLHRLDREAPVQASAIRHAAENDGFIPRAAVYELGEYDGDRTLRGFTRPVNRISNEFRERGLISENAIDVLTAVYDPEASAVQAAGFRVPEPVVELLQQ